MIKYKADTFYKEKVSRVEVVRESDHNVWVKNHRGDEYMERKQTNHHKYFNEKQAALDYLENHLQRNIDHAKSRLEYWEDKMKRFKIESEELF